MVDITTGAGRIVWGSPINGRPVVDDRTKQPKLDKNGQPMTQWAFGLAIPKAEAGPLMQALQQAAAEVFPSGTPGNFSWKLKDGDGVDKNGQPYSAREGYAGCYVIAVSTTAFQPQVVKNVNGAYVETTEIKTGDYVRAALSLKAHQSQTPGVYVNPVMVEFIGYGEAIQNGPDAMTVFGGQQVALPPGASAVPTAPTAAMPVPGMPMPAPNAPVPPTPGMPIPGQPMPGGAPAPAPAPVPAAGQPPMAAPAAAAPGMPTASPGNPPVQPAHDFVQNAGQPAAPGQPAMPAGGPAWGQPQ